MNISNASYLIGSWIQTASPISAELMAHCGFDFLAIDVEHSAIDLPQVQVLLQAIRSGNPHCLALVRLSCSDYAAVKRFMDAGASGVIAPLINSADSAREIVRAVKYPPDGERGVGFCRDNMYGLNIENRVKSANEETFTCVQIEHVRAVENIDQILSVHGVDAILVGPYDLSASMDITAHLDHEDYKAAIDKILHACKKHDVMAGIHIVQPDVDEVFRRIDQGFRMIAYSLDVTMMSHMSINGLKEIRSRLRK